MVGEVDGGEAVGAGEHVGGVRGRQLVGHGGATTLGAFAAGAATARVFSDAQGIATTEFNAGPEAAAGAISATVEGTNFSWVGQINLIKVTPGFWAPQNMVPVMVTAATAVTIGIVKAATKDDPVPIQPTGSTIIKP